MSLRKLILFICQDNPPTTDNNEKHRTTVSATSYNDIGLQLFVVSCVKIEIMVYSIKI